MAPRGPAPKPAHMRQRTNKKAGNTTIEAPASDDVNVPNIPNPDARTWHPLTLAAWAHAWTSPMSSQWLETDQDALGRLALLWDQFYQKPDSKVLGEVRLQEQRFGLSPLDRSRLQWEVSRAEDAEDKQRRKRQPGSGTTGDPRKLLTMVAKK